MKRSLTRTLAPATLGAALLAVAVVGCSSDGGDHSVDTAASDSGAVAAEGPAGAPALVDSDGSLSTRAGREAEPTQPQALIRKANVALRADDVGDARLEVQRVVDRYAGQVTDEKTQSDDDGGAAYARLVLRVPTEDFSRAVDDLKGVGELESASTNEDDVTDEVIDAQTRLRVQERSIARITVLFDRAQSIRDIMAIEAQLSRRQADLESLKQQAAYLADQTSLSTIVVSIDQIPPARSTPKDDDSGFMAGLSAGWGALTSFAVGLATAAGAALPWAVVVAVLGVPLLLLVRALRRRAQAQASE